jgi:hypothetical protein
MLLTGPWRCRPMRLAVLLLLASVAGSACARAHFLVDISPAAEEPPGGETGEGSGDVAGRAVAQLQLGCDPSALAEAGRNPFAETVLGRTAPAVLIEAEARRALTAAMLSHDYAYAFDRAAALRAAADPSLRYLGWLLPAYVLAKAQPAGWADTLADLLPRLREAATSARLSTADLHYLAAVAAVAQGRAADARPAVDAALAEEPVFFNAMVLGLGLRLAAMAAEVRTHTRCERAFAELFDDLVDLVGLTRCPLQASQTELYLRRQLPDPARNAAFLAAQVYLGIIARRAEHAEAALQRFDALPALACKVVVSGQLHRLLERGQETLKQERQAWAP